MALRPLFALVALLLVSWVAADSTTNLIIQELQEKGLYDGPFALMVTVQVKPGQEDTLIDQMKIITADNHGSLGNLFFECIRSTDDLSQFTMIEKWANGDDLSLHLEDPILLNYLQILGDIQAETPVAKIYSLLTF